jgi:2-methylcitrate dehydratase PrpD
MVWDKTTSFKLPQGLAARSGIFSAQLAGTGWGAAEDALLSRFGYFHLYTEGCKLPELLTGDLGRKYYSDGTFKPYPACRLTHAGIDCALVLIKKYGIQAEDIKEATLYISAGGLAHLCGHPFIIGEFPHAAAIFSSQYTVATALLYNSVRPEHFTETAIRDARVNDMIKKIKLAEWPGAELHAARLSVNLKDGRTLTEECEVVRGDPTNPLSEEEIVAKFRNNVEFSGTITAEKAEKLLDLLERVEDLDSVSRVVSLLVP